jgi:predicted transcriptional regulator
MTSSKKNAGRRSRPDYEDEMALYLIKGPTSLRATDQIRRLAQRARSAGKKLYIKVKPTCSLEPSLVALRSEFDGVLVIVEKF